MERRSGQPMEGTAASRNIRRPVAPRAPAGEAAVLIMVLGTKVVYQVAPGYLPPGQW